MLFAPRLQGPGTVPGAQPRFSGAGLPLPGAASHHPPEGGVDARAGGLDQSHALNHLIEVVCPPALFVFLLRVLADNLTGDGVESH